MTATKTLLQGPIEAKDIHAPLDGKRTSVRSLQWKPFFLTNLTTKSQPDLVALVHLLVEVQPQSNKVLPILVDANVHYRLCKMMYRESYAKYNLALSLNRCPVLYGLWNPYKYAVTVCYKHFCPLFVLLTQRRLSSGTEVYPHSKLSCTDRDVAAILIVVNSCKPALERLKASNSNARPDMCE